MDRIILNDGTEINGGFVSRSSRNQLMVRVPGSNLAQAAITFSDPEKTKKIICFYGIYKTTYTGYTVMYSVQYFQDGDYVELWMKPEENAETSYDEEIIVPKQYVPLETAKEAVNEDA